MKKLMVLLSLLVFQYEAYCQPPGFPIHISENGRYFIDKNMKPFFYQADTPWLLFINLNEKEMSDYMEIRIRQGFTVLQTTALTRGFNVQGEKPFKEDDFSKPNLLYFNHIRKGIDLAKEKGLWVGLVPVWKGCCGGDWSEIISKNGPERCREYGRFLGSFFGNCKNLFWILGGDNDPREHIDHYRQIALGILEGMPDALLTYHAASGHSSTDVIPYIDNSWLSFSMTYTYFPKKHNVWIYMSGLGELPEVYVMHHIEYRKYPIRPFILGESQYEGEDTLSYAPLSGSAVVRRQAYWSFLSGGCGHAYGSWCWMVDERWPQIESDQGAWDMKHVKQFFEAIEWYDLVPDISQKLIAEGAGTYGGDDYVVAAISNDRRFAVVYIPPTGTDSRKLVLNMDVFAHPVKAIWFNPTRGEYIPLSDTEILNCGLYSCTSPGDNGDGVNDWILLLREN